MDFAPVAVRSPIGDCEVSGRALITGGAGFVGSHLAGRLVDDGWDVLAIDDLSKGKVSRLADARRRGSPFLYGV